MVMTFTAYHAQCSAAAPNRECACYGIAVDNTHISDIRTHILHVTQNTFQLLTN